MAKRKVLTESDANFLEKRFSQVFLTKKDFQKFKSELFSRIDPILKEIITAREERPIITKKQGDHEKRITTLEEIHPDGKHQAASP